MGKGFRVTLQGRNHARQSCEWRPTKEAAMALWRTLMRTKNAGDRIAVQNMKTGKYEVIEHG